MSDGNSSKNYMTEADCPRCNLGIGDHKNCTEASKDSKPKETVHDVAVKLLIMADSPFWCKTAPRDEIANELRRLSEVLRGGR